MDALVHSPSSMAKRPCPSQNPTIPNPNHSDIDHILHSLLRHSDSSLLSVDLSFDRLLDSSASDSDQTLLIDRAFKLGSALLEASKRSARKRASKHNSLAWVLPPDLTIKVRFLFSPSDFF